METHFKNRYHLIGGVLMLASCSCFHGLHWHMFEFIRLLVLVSCSCLIYIYFVNKLIITGLFYL
jgi:hypothetical protein